MNKVLLLDTSFAARPIHDWLLEQQFDVWTIGNRPSDVLAVRNPDRHLNDNYSDVEVVQAHIDRLGITYVVPGCTDISIETALQLTNIDTVYDTPQTYHSLADKAAFRSLCARVGLPSPKRVMPQDLPVTGKLIAKPTDSFSGRGITVFDGADRDAGLAALESARAESRTGDALLETYAQGQLYSYHVLIENKTTSDFIIVREDGSVTPYAVDTSYVDWDFPAHGKEQLSSAMQSLAQELDLVDGLMHVQFIWDGEKPWLVELSRRCPGDLYPRLAELSTGQPYFARFASYFVGKPLSFDTAPTPRHILRHTVTANHETYEGFWPTVPLPIAEFHPLLSVGRPIPPNNRTDRVALMFAQYGSQQELVLSHQAFLDKTAYKTLPA